MLQSEYHISMGYRVRPCLKNTQKNGFNFSSPGSLKYLISLFFDKGETVICLKGRNHITVCVLESMNLGGPSGCLSHFPHLTQKPKRSHRVGSLGASHLRCLARGSGHGRSPSGAGWEKGGI